MIGTSKVDFGEDLSFNESCQEMRHGRNGIGVLFGHRIEFVVVHTKSVSLLDARNVIPLATRAAK